MVVVEKLVGSNLQVMQNQQQVTWFVECGPEQLTKKNHTSCSSPPSTNHVTCWFCIACKLLPTHCSTTTTTPMVSPPGGFFFLMFLSLFIFCFSHYNYLDPSRPQPQRPHTPTASTRPQATSTRWNSNRGAAVARETWHVLSGSYVFFYLFCLLFYYINTFFKPT